MANSPTTIFVDAAPLIERLAARSLRLDAASLAHLLGELRQLLSLPHGELMRDYGRYEGRLLDPDALAFLDDVTTKPVKPGPMPAELRTIAEEIGRLPDEPRRVMVLYWSFELHMKAKWETTLARSGGEFRAALDAEAGSSTNGDWRN